AVLDLLTRQDTPGDLRVRGLVYNNFSKARRRATARTEGAAGRVQQLAQGRGLSFVQLWSNVADISTPRFGASHVLLNAAGAHFLGNGISTYAHASGYPYGAMVGPPKEIAVLDPQLLP